MQNWRVFLSLFGLFVLALVMVLNFAPISGLMLPDDHAFREVLAGQAMINMIFIIAGIIFYALAALHRAESELRRQYERSEALIEIVMPESVARRLKSGREQRISDRIDLLSVSFADLVGFSTAAHDLPPDQVVEYLDGLVRTFDALAEAHKVEKIKTIGDCYMAATGFDGCAREGAAAIGRLALLMLEATERQAPLGSHENKARIGIHSGPAMAGVIGDTRISYDVWGDAVNVASRMESHGLPGRIQVSESCCELTGDVFVVGERGTTELKGIGVARTFFLIGERTLQQPSLSRGAAA